MKNKEQTSFGEREVTADEKTQLVRGVFDSVADKYDLMNDLMSGGVHRLWKDRFIRTIRPRTGQRFLDVAGGTGDIAFRIRDKIGAQKPDTKSDITVFDLNEDMLTVGRDRAIDRGWLNGFDWITGDAATLPFEDNSFDTYTISFGLRNVTRIDDALKEAHRVLKPGGRFYCLEFSHIENPAMAAIYDQYSYKIIPEIGKIVAQDRESYQYLVESIRKFPKQQNLCDRMEKAGLANARFENLSFGVVAIHQGWKL